jgi:hypothetical protein
VEQKMSHLGKHWRDGDPLADAPALSPDDAQCIRRAVVAAAGRPAPTWRPRPILVAATVAATLAVGVVIGRRMPHDDGVFGRPAAAGDMPRVVEPARRQVQFDTPGGTRIIWVIDPDFDW